MCRYELPEISPPRHCQLAGYFEQAPQLAQPKDPVLNFPPLPVDGAGYCIFHSRDIDWKIKNKFSKWVDNLVAYIKCYDKVMYIMTHPQTLKVVDLTGVLLIGKEMKNASGTKEAALKLKNLRLTDHIEIRLEYAEILDKLCFEGCQIGKTEISLNHTIINAELYMSNTSVGQLTFNDARLNGGLLINNCEFTGYADFSGVTVSNMLQISKSHFQTHAYFTSSNLRCESVLIDNVQFQGKADFGQCTFHGDVEFQDCTFNQLLNFGNARLNGPAAFTGNYYEENVQFTSSETKNKVFYDNVNFTFINKENEIQQRIIFDNVNFYLIGGKDREELNELARLNKVTIGSGCIKYRVQTPPVTIQTGDINKNIARELAQSFTNYFTSSTGKNLGVEFINNTINKVTLFYYTDEDITEQELFDRLKLVEKAYWASSEPGTADTSPEETKLKIDNYVSKVAVLIKMAMLQERDLMPEGSVQEVVKAIGFNDIATRARDLQININHYHTMKIGKVIAQSNSQVNIAENIKKIEFNPTVKGVTEQDIEQIKALLALLDTNEIQELQQELHVLPQEANQSTVSERVFIRLNDLAVRHGLPIFDGLAASALFELLKMVF